MPIDIPVPDVAWFGIRATLDGVQVETGHYFRKLVPPITPTNLEEEANRLMLAWRFFLVPQLSSGITWREVAGIDLTPGSGVSVAVPFSVGPINQGSPEPNHVAFSLMPFGATIPRPWAWRFRLFGVPRSKVIGNFLQATWANNMRTAVRDRYTLQGAFGWRPSVVQKVIAGVVLSQGIPHDVTDYTIPTLVVSPMRRRLTEF